MVERQGSAKAWAVVLAVLAGACGGGGAGGTTPSDPARIGPAGGTVTTASGVRLTVPAGALSVDTTLTVVASGTNGPSGHPIFTFGPAGTTFAVPITVRLPRPASLQAGAAAALYWTRPGSATAYDALAASVAADGVTAQVDHFSNGFVGAPCAAGAACSDGLAACRLGTMACSTGAPACVEAGAAPDGTACGADLVCAAGACQPVSTARTVTVRNTTTYWPDSGVRTTVEHLPTGWTVEGVLVPDPASPDGYASRPAAPAATGIGWDVADVPPGPYFVEVSSSNVATTWMYQRSGDAVAFDSLTAARPDLVTTFPTEPIVTLDVTGMSPWISPGSNLFISGSQSRTDAWPLSLALRPAAGATSHSATFRWNSTILLAGLGLPDASKGDVLYVTQREPRPLSCAGSATQVAVVAAARLAAFPAFVPGQATTLTAELTPVPLRTIPADVQVDQFSALAAAMGPGAVPDTLQGINLAVFSLPHTSAGPDAPDLVARNGYMQLLPGEAGCPTMPYGDAFDEVWKPYLQLVAPYEASMTSAAGNRTHTMSYQSYVAVDASLPAQVAPVLGPVAQPLVDGRDVAGNLATPVGLSPVLSWSPPAIGAPTGYTVSIYELAGVGGSLRPVLVASVTSGTSFRIPAKFLSPYRFYFAQIVANREPWQSPDGNPFAWGTPAQYAPMVTGSFLVAPISTGFQPPAGTIPVDFKVDDTANQVWKDGELAWKGSMRYDATTRSVTHDPTWAGPFARLYDDGPWDASPAGHEPSGSVAGDHLLGVTVFVAPGATAQEFGYGLIDAASNGWLWQGANGAFTVPANAYAPVSAAGLAFPAAGDVDLRFELDGGALVAAQPPYATTTVKVQGSMTGWNLLGLVDDGTKGDRVAGDGIFTATLSSWPGVSAPPYTGLARRGAQVEFLFQLTGVDYREQVAGVYGPAALQGITVSAMAPGAAVWTPLVVSALDTSNRNNAVTVPP